MKSIKILLVGIFFSLVAFSQNASDALRYSQTTLTGTARFSAMGGSFGALGGDFSSLSFNPAGIAVYRKSEFTFTPSVFTQTTNSTYQNQTTTDDKYNFNFGNLGVVFAGPNPDEGSNWKSFAFGVGFNRLNNFSNNVSITGYNKTGSMLDLFVNEAGTSNHDDLDNFSAGLAYNAYLIEHDKTGAPYYHVLPNYGEKQQKNISTTGRIGETVISGGGNYMDKLYIGATLGIERIVYYENSSFRESLDDPNSSYYKFKYYQLNRDVTTGGTGINFKAGLIYRATDWLRLGGAIHTPTFYSLTDSYVYSINSAFGSGSKDTALWGTHSAKSPDGSYNYSLRTPFKAMGSVAFVLGKKGLINVDYEYVDYSSAKLSGDNNAFSDDNSTIRTQYVAANNIRIGAEYRFDPFSLRAGYGLYGNPYKNNGDLFNGARTNYSFGLGYRTNSFYLDAAYVLSFQKEGYYMYDSNYVPVTEKDMKSSTFLLTAGFRF